MPKKILAVDDERTTLKLIEQALLPQGYQILLAATGEEALETAKKESPDLVLMDLMLPDIEGGEVVRRLRAIPATSDIPVIILSGIVQPDIGESDNKVNVSGLFYPAIAKPFSHDELVEKIHSFLQ